MIDKRMKNPFNKIIYQLLLLACVSAFYSPAWAEEKTVVIPVLKQLFANAGDTQITLHWKIDHADKLRLIRLYRKDYPLPLPAFKVNKGKETNIDKGELIAELKAGETQFVDSNVMAGFYYAYRMQMQYEQQPEGKISAPAIAALKDKQPPQPPVLKSLKALDEKQIEIRWQASSSKDVVTYRLYRATQKGKPQIIRRINVHQANKKILTDVFQHQGNSEFIYRYALAAVDSAGNVSEKTAYKHLRMPDKIAPRPPALLHLDQQNDQVILQWLENRENDIFGYRVYRRDAVQHSVFKPIHEKLLKHNQFIDKQVEPLKSYYYRVSAVDMYDNESRETSGVLFRTTTFTDELPAPQKLNITSNRHDFPHLQWEYNKTKAHVQFIVQRSDGGEFENISGLLTRRQFTDKNASPNHAYRYRVQALDTNGQYSPASNIVLWTGGGAI